MKNLVMRKIISGIIVATTVIAAAIPTFANDKRSDIIVDGDLSDWEGIEEHMVDIALPNEPSVDSFSAVYSADGTKLYVSYKGTSQNRGENFVYYNMKINYPNGTYYLCMNNMKYSGGNIAYTNSSITWSSPGDYTVEVEIPTSFLQDSNFNLEFVGVKNTSAPLDSKDIKKVDEYAPVDTNPEEPTEPPKPSTYDGIVIDGKFDDWAAVEKVDGSKESYCLTDVASVFDGDYVYLYLKEAPYQSATNAGSHGNGMYSIVTDLGRSLVFQLNRDGTVSGYDGIEAKYYASQWEIAIPKSILPKYEKTVSIGLYQQDPFVSDMANLNGDSGNVGSFNGIVYDGLFGDWEAYPHKLIQYATSGTSETLADGELALYSNGDTIFGHVVSAMTRHTSRFGAEMCSAISIRINNSNNTVFYPRLVAVDEKGNINWNPNFDTMKEGQKYEYYIMSRDAWGSSKNINELNEHDLAYGKITIDVGGYGKVDEAEFYLDMNMIAKKFGLSEHDIKYVEAQFGQIGNEWVGCAGTSSGPWMGIALGLVTVAVPVFIKKRKHVSMQ